LDWEIIPRLLIKEFKFDTIPIISSKNSSSIIYSNLSFEGNYCQYHSRGHQVVEHAFIVDLKLRILKTKSKESGFDLKQLVYAFYSLELSKRKKQLLEFQFIKGRLIYFKSGIFDASKSCAFHFNLDFLKP
jgi:hypothetical protein